MRATRMEAAGGTTPERVGTAVARTPATDAQRKSDGLHALANLAEREGQMAAAAELARWADETAPFVPYGVGTRCQKHRAFEPDNCPGCGTSAVIPVRAR